MSTWTVVGEGPWADALTHRLTAGGHPVSGPDDLAERILIAVSAEALEATLRPLAPRLQGNHRVLTCVPGLTPDGHRPGEAVLTLTPVRQVAVLAGGATPEAIREAKPAALVVASAFPAWAGEIQAAFARLQRAVAGRLHEGARHSRNRAEGAVCRGPGPTHRRQRRRPDWPF